MTRLRHDLKVVDLAVELIDARIPVSSRNPALAGMLSGKKHLLLLHKADQAEEEVTFRWLVYFKGMDQKAMPFSIHKKNAVNDLFRYLREQEVSLRPARLKRPLRMLFVGIPNVGKSSLINLLARKAVTKTGNRPGITRGRQWIRITPGLELLDTPGILTPKLTEKSTPRLAAVGSIPAGRFDPQEAVLWLLGRLLLSGKKSHLEKRYGVISSDDTLKVLEEIGRSQGCLQAAGKIDLERAAAIVLRDFQGGALGRMSLEEPAQDSALLPNGAS